MNALDPLNAQFGIPGMAAIVAAEGGMPAVRITSPAASAEIYLHGAHVTAWRPAGAEEMIFLSAHSRWEHATAIRGGIPICFPWFGAKADDAKAPQHGFARTSEWQLASITQDGDNITVTLALESSDATRALWPHQFQALYRVTSGPELKLELTVTNSGQTPFQFEEALHTYHQVGDARQVSIAGLDAASYLDKMDGFREKVQQGDVAFTAPTDRVYLATSSAITIEDPALHRRVTVEKHNSLNTVVWNPWAEGAKTISDLGDDEWTSFVCVEACNSRNASVVLSPGEEHTMQVTVRTR